jgi:hypothetical protein
VENKQAPEQDEIHEKQMSMNDWKKSVNDARAHTEKPNEKPKMNDRER